MEIRIVQAERALPISPPTGTYVQVQIRQMKLPCAGHQCLHVAAFHISPSGSTDGRWMCCVIVRAYVLFYFLKVILFFSCTNDTFRLE